VVLTAVGAAFEPAFAITGGMALLAALLLGGRLLARRPRHLEVVAAAALLALALPAGYAVAERALAPDAAEIADPCEPRERRSIGGIEGVVEDVVLRGLDRAACRFGSSREELVLALFDEQSQREYERSHGIDPRQLDDVLRELVRF